MNIIEVMRSQKKHRHTMVRLCGVLTLLHCRYIWVSKLFDCGSKTTVLRTAHLCHSSFETSALHRGKYLTSSRAEIETISPLFPIFKTNSPHSGYPAATGIYLFSQGIQKLKTHPLPQWIFGSGWGETTTRPGWLHTTPMVITPKPRWLCGT